MADSVRLAVVAASRGGRATAGIARAVTHAISQLPGTTSALEKHTIEIARPATRGAIHAADEVAIDVGHVARAAVIGALNGMQRTGVDPLDVLSGAIYGTLQGADEAGADTGDTASHAIQGARDAVTVLGLSEQEATAAAAQIVLNAAQTLSPDARDQVERSARDELTPTED